MKKLLALSLLATAYMHASQTPLASPDKEAFDKDKSVITVGIFIAKPRTDGRTDSYKEKELYKEMKGEHLTAITDGKLRYTYYDAVFRFATENTTAGTLIEDLQRSLGCTDTFLRNKSCHLYLKGEKIDSKAHILEKTPVHYLPPKKHNNEVWKKRVNAANWALVGFETGVTIPNEIHPSIRVAGEIKKDYKKYYKTFSHIHNEQNEQLLNEFHIVETNSKNS
jgi:hypothetical protein